MVEINKGNGKLNIEMASKIVGQLAIWRIDSKNFTQACLSVCIRMSVCMSVGMSVCLYTV